jgi:hypothetical protein
LANDQRPMTDDDPSVFTYPDFSCIVLIGRNDMGAA